MSNGKGISNLFLQTKSEITESKETIMYNERDAM